MIRNLHRSSRSRLLLRSRPSSSLLLLGQKQQQRPQPQQQPNVCNDNKLLQLRSLSSTTSSSSSSTTTTSLKYELSETEKEWYKRGIVNEIGLTNFSTLHELITNSYEVYANNDFLGTYNADANKFEFKTYQEMHSLTNKCRTVLKDLGVEQYGKVGIIANNRWEWAAVASAAFSLNSAIVPMYEAQLPSDWNYIVNDSGCSVLFCANQDIYDRVQKHVVPSAPLLRSVVSFDTPTSEEYSFQKLMNQAKEDADGTWITAPLQEDLANLIYTSGTTGKPKGVELVHSNFASNVMASSRYSVEDPRTFLREGDRTLAFLPWAHSYGQTCELWVNWAHGLSSGVCRGVPFILEDLQLVQPSVLYAVPTLYKRVFDGVMNIMETSSANRKKLMQRAFYLGRRKVEADRNMGSPPLSFLERIQYKVLDSIVLSKVRARFGGNLRHGYVAGAACPAEILNFMDSLGIPIFEGYGLTETSPIITMNAPGKRSVGSVGKPLKDITVYIIDGEGNPIPPGEEGEGEICCVGPNIMKGYYRNKEETDKVISLAPDGKSRMFHTGDLGKQDQDGFVRVTGRIKEQYKLENGKYIVPTPIEETIGMSRFILQVVLVGANRPYNTVLIVPDWNSIKAELDISEDSGSNNEDALANDARVKELIDSEIHAACYKKLKKFEVPQKWAFISPCTVANNMLTAKMSIRMHNVVAAYEELISGLYNDNSDASKRKDETTTTTRNEEAA